MNYKLTIVLLFLGFLAASPDAHAQPARIVVIRHGEKPPEGDNLSCQGFNRSLKLPAVLHQKFGLPDFIFVPSVKSGKAMSQSRMYQTIIPFAVKYNLNIDDKFSVGDTEGLAKGILKKKGTVLVVWEHKNIGKLLGVLGAKEKMKWDDSDFDTILVLTFANGKLAIAKDKENIQPAANCAF